MARDGPRLFARYLEDERNDKASEAPFRRARLKLDLIHGDERWQQRGRAVRVFCPATLGDSRRLVCHPPAICGVLAGIRYVLDNQRLAVVPLLLAYLGDRPYFGVIFHQAVC